MVKNQIGTVQFALLLTVTRLYNLLNYIPKANGTKSVASLLLGNLFSLAVSILLAVTAGFLYKKCKGSSPVEAVFEKNKFFGTALAVIFSLALFLNLCGSLAAFSYFLTSAVYQNASGVFITLLMGAGCFLGAYYGLEGVSRASFIIFFYFLISFFFVIAGSVNNFEFSRIMPVTDRPFLQVTDAACEIISKTFEFIAAMILFPKVKTKKGITSSLVWFSVLYFLLSEGLILAIGGVFGEFSMSLEFPLYALVSSAEISIFTRLNSVHMILWVFLSFIRITVFIIAVQTAIGYIVKKPKEKQLLRLILPPALILSAVFSTLGEKIKNINPTSGIIVITTSLIIPLLLMIYLSVKKRRSYEKSDIIKLDDNN